VDDTKTELRVLLGPTGLRDLGSVAAPTQVLPLAAQSDDDRLHWTFESDRGEKAEGDVGDPRIVHAESHDENHRIQELRAQSGILRLTVPAAKGRLTVTAKGEKPLSLLLGTASNVKMQADDQGSGSSWPPPSILGARANACAGAVRVIVSSEGYTAGEMADFRAHAQRMIDDMFRQLPDFAAHRDQFDFYLNEVPSNESGIGEPGAPKDTAFRLEHGDVRGAIGRRSVWSRSGWSTRASMQWLSAQTQVMGDIHLIVANTTEYGGAAQYSTRTLVTTRSESAGPVLGHEIGHALVWLADEYAYAEEASRCDLKSAGGRRNTTQNAADPPWSSYVTSTPVEGAEYCLRGVYRPTESCLMHSVGDSEMCPVCRRAFEELLLARRTRVAEVRSECAAPAPANVPCNTLGADACGANNVCAWNGTDYCCKASAQVSSTAATCSRDGDCRANEACAQASATAPRLTCVPAGREACIGAAP